MWLLQCKCGRGKKQDSSVIPEEVVNDVEESPEVVDEDPAEDKSETSFVDEAVFGDDAERDEKVIKRFDDLLGPYLSRDSMKALRVTYNEYVYLEENLLVSISKEKLLEIIAGIIQKRSVNKWVSHFDGMVYIFKKRSKLLGFKKKKDSVVKNSIIEYHLEKEEHTDNEKRLICIEEELVRVPEVAK